MPELSMSNLLRLKLVTRTPSDRGVPKVESLVSSLAEAYKEKGVDFSNFQVVPYTIRLTELGYHFAAACINSEIRVVPVRHFMPFVNDK